MTQSIAQFGPNRALVGVLTEPERLRKDRPAVLLMNAGLLHRVGPHRLNRDLAAALASDGHLVMRFDFTGIGDSERPVSERDQTPASFEEQIVSETCAAMDHLATTRGVNRFVLAGMCLGADAALRTALTDSRAMAIVLINPTSLETTMASESDSGAREAEARGRAEALTRTQLRAYIRKVRNPRNWLRLLSGKSNLRALVGTLARTLRPRTPTDTVPPDIRVLRERGIRCLLAYSTESTTWEFFRVAHKRAIQRLNDRTRFDLRVVDGADHIFTLLWSQHHLTHLVTTWMHSDDHSTD